MVSWFTETGPVQELPAGRIREVAARGHRERL